MSSADRDVVPLNSRCSRKWLVPASGPVPPREPTGTHTPTLALRTPGIASDTIRNPPGRTVRVIVPPPVAVSRRLVRARAGAADVTPRSYGARRSGPHAAE